MKSWSGPESPYLLTVLGDQWLRRIQVDVESQMCVCMCGEQWKEWPGWRRDDVSTVKGTKAMAWVKKAFAPSQFCWEIIGIRHCIRLKANGRLVWFMWTVKWYHKKFSWYSSSPRDTMRRKKKLKNGEKMSLSWGLRICCLNFPVDHAAVVIALYAASLGLIYLTTRNLYFFLWLCHAAYGILVSWPGIEPGPLAVEVWSRNHWTTREVPFDYLSPVSPWVLKIPLGGLI